MGASSVTGVGDGSASAGVKGPHNGRDFFKSLLTPHVAAAGTAILDSGGTVTVTFNEPLAGAGTDYAIMLTSMAASKDPYVSTKTTTSGEFVSFVITGTAENDLVMWSVIKAGGAQNEATS